MATIIDFSPTAHEIDSMASTSVPKRLEPLPKPQLSDVPNILTDREASKTFYSHAPDMLFVSEYAPKGQFKGVLVAFENYYNATHYEVFKRNKMAVDSSWKRILVITSSDLANESLQYLPYVTSFLAIPFQVPKDGYIILDTDVILDRIYEYKIIATHYPGQAQPAAGTELFLYDVMLRSHGLTRDVEVANLDTLNTVSSRFLGSEDYGWVIALLNQNVYYFGAEVGHTSFSQMKLGTVTLPNDFNDIVNIFVSSTHQFGLSASVYNLLLPLRKPEINAAFFNAVNQSFDETSQTFSFRSLTTRLTSIYPAYKQIQDIANGVKKSNASDIASVTIFQYDDVANFNSFSTLHLFILQLNTIFINVISNNSKLANLK